MRERTGANDGAPATVWARCVSCAKLGYMWGPAGTSSTRLGGVKHVLAVGMVFTHVVDEVV